MTDRLANAQERVIKMMEVTFKQCYQEGYNEGYDEGYKDGVQNPSSLGFDHGYERGLNDAWKKVKEELIQYSQCKNTEDYSDAICDALKIINKHLSGMSK